MYVFLIERHRNPFQLNAIFLAFSRFSKARAAALVLLNFAHAHSSGFTFKATVKLSGRIGLHESRDATML